MSDVFDNWAANARDCGTFFIDIAGHFTPEKIVAAWSDEPRPTDDVTEQAIERTWNEQTEIAQREGRSLFDGSLCRLIDYSGGRRLELKLGPVSYREFVGTNLFNARLRYSQGPEVLANPLGVSAALTTNDGFIVLALRSQKVAFHAGRLHPIGGMVPPTGSHQPPAPWQTMVDELHEETSTPPTAVRDNLCLGMVRDKAIVQPELIFDLAVDLDVATLRQGHQRAEDRAEHAELVPIRNLPSSVVDFMRTHIEQLTPVALATLLLHGSRRWGTGWFTTARGFLGKVL